MTTPTNQYDSEGRPHGVWVFNWPNGTPWWRGHYLHGKPYGGWEWYYTDGTVEGKKYYITIK
jgi:antitoxin component YwqK of YwqJK toxin-antitoxin module